MSNIFHLAVLAGHLPGTLPFYTDILECKLGPSEDGKWQDIDFWGNELTLHESTPRTQVDADRERHDVDMGAVCIPHFGIHIEWDAYLRVKENIRTSVGFFDDPYIRFEGQETQQETFFVEDPNLNVLEIKSLQGSYYGKR